jgi:hypothetical protein
VERITRDPEWLEEPGAAEFPFGRADALELVA